MPEADTHLASARLRSGAAASGARAGAARDTARGVVVQVNVSPGGVPKLPVEGAFVGRLGLEGDDHHDVADHGGPNRAVCLLSIEVIRRIAAEGHPIAPGTTGENITAEGIEFGALPSGTRLAIGDSLVLELTEPTTPCKTIRESFSDGRFVRLGTKLHGIDTRVYARVVREGMVRAGDAIQVLAAEVAANARAEPADRLGGAGGLGGPTGTDGLIDSAGPADIPPR